MDGGCEGRAGIVVGWTALDQITDEERPAPVCSRQAG